MRRLFLIRHAPADSSGYVGWSDPALGERGLSEAKLVGERMSGEEVGAVYSSDLRRARETAEEVARALGVSVRVREEFRELHFGEWEGRSHEELVERDGERYGAWLSDPESVSPPGGETFARLDERVRRGFERALDETKGENVAVVAHGGPLRLIACRLLGMPPENHWRLGVSRSGVTTFEWTSEDSLPVLRGFDEVSHLRTRAL